MFGTSILVAAAVLAAGCGPAVAQQSAHPEMRTPAGGSADVRLSRVRLASGVELEVAEAGASTGTPVLFLHGYIDSWFSFSAILERLPPGVRAIVPSQRGHGDSDRPVCCYGIGDFAADALELLDALGIERAAVVGHSMGSFVAQRIAADRPDRVTRLVLIGSGSTLQTELLIGFAEFVEQMADPIAPALIHEFQVGTVAHAPPAPFVARIVEESGKLPVRIWREAMRGMVRADSRTPLSRIAVPVLIMWGEQDVIFPRAHQDSLMTIRGAQLVTYAETGHAPHWERPDRVAADLTSFLGLGSSSSAPAVSPARRADSSGAATRVSPAP
jgi:non-heme chloroperoxidase